MTGSALAEPNYAEVMRAIAVEIAALAPEFPQLKEFSVDHNVQDLRIDYDYHTHRSPDKPGWLGAARWPDDDGIWLVINVHDPDPAEQIETKPVLQPLCIGTKRVLFLIWEGDKTKRASHRISSILRSHGVKDC